MPGGGKGGGGGTSSTVTVNNGPIDVDSTVDINGLNDIKVTAVLPQPFKTESRQELVLPQPFKTESRQELVLPQPLKTETDLDTNSTLSVDLKPVALDVCMTSSTKLPQGQISQPFNVHFGLTWFGMEFFGFNFGGESRMVLQDLPKKPAVEWPAQQNAAPYASSAPYRDDHPPMGQPRGLRVRIK
jgi:hypothetical protein